MARRSRRGVAALLGGLRVSGTDKAEGCDDTRLVQPVAALDRAGLKKAVRGRPSEG